MTGRSAIPRRDVLKRLSLVPATWIPMRSKGPSPTPPLVFSCLPTNGLYKVLTHWADSLRRYDTPSEAVARSPRGAGVLVLAEGYPQKTTQLESAVFHTAMQEKLRLYVEFPSSIPGLRTSEPRAPEKGSEGNVLERVVVASSAFSLTLPERQILDIHDCRYVPVQPGTGVLEKEGLSREMKLVLARVAGYDTAIYGLPPEGVKPILFTAPEGDILIATTKLSQFITGRYSPVNAWRLVWNWILAWLSPQSGISVGEFIPAVGPSFTSHQPLPRTAELEAYQRGVEWFSKAKLFVDRSWKQTVDERQLLRRPSPGPAPDWPLGDGSEGVLEGVSSIIEQDGSQLLSWAIRNDCTGETSMVMAFSSLIGGKSRDQEIAVNLSDYIYRSPLAQGSRSDPQSPSFGLVGWELPKAEGAYWGDDNARSMMGTLAAGALLRSDRWDENVLRCLLANLRTTGRLGFRGHKLDEKPLQEHGWRYFYNGETVNYAPHFEAYLWACCFWAYGKTRSPLFLERARNAVRMTMAAYPDQWRWTNGLQQERARMLLPLAWLIRIEDKPEYRQWLLQIAKDLLALQDECGAIREEMGRDAKGLLLSPRSNDRYGTSEAPLIQQNGDPACDLLYTTNFAFLGLHEAAAATGDPFYRQAEDKLAEFLCRIQIRSAAHPELDGGWFRAFDFKRWDYWASDSDSSWGVCCIETGWTQTWITSVLALRHLRTSLWDLTAQSTIARFMDKLLPVMLPQAGSATPRHPFEQQ